MSTLAPFNTITADDWKRSISRARVEGNSILMQIRARCAPLTSRTVDHRQDRRVHTAEAPGSTPGGAPNFTGVGSAVPTEERREALTRRESLAPVTSLLNREGNCPPLEFTSPIATSATTPGEPRENAADACPVAAAESRSISAINP